MEAELTALPHLPPLPAPITRPVFEGTMPLGARTCPFAGYPYLPGALLAAGGEAPGAALGRFLRALHDVDVAPLRARGLAPDAIWRLDVARRKGPVLDALALAQREGLGLTPHLDALARAESLVLPHQEAICHGDLDPRHVLVDQGDLAGVIDWGDIHIGHPATDLGLAFALSPDQRDAFFAAYGAVTDEVAAAARARAIMSAARVYAWALDIDSTMLRRYALGALEHAAPP